MGMMYICEDCGCVFDEDDNVREDRETGAVWVECPQCKSDYVTEAEECRDCGTVTRVDDLHEGLCEDCAENMLDDSEYVVDYIANNLDDFWELIKSNYSEAVLAKMLYSEFSEDAIDYCREELDDFIWTFRGKYC